MMSLETRCQANRQQRLLSNELVSHWSLNLGQSVGAFTRRQEDYLEYHREGIFKH